MNGQNYRSKHAVQAQNVFRHLVRNAKRIGMVVNASKTAMICASGATDYEAELFILDSNGERIGCGAELKALGLRFSANLDMEAHVSWIIKTIRSRYWTLRNLKLNGFSTEELIQVYKTMLRPVAEYACVVFHSSLTDDQDERLERLQNHALKAIFGPGISARRMRGLADLDTLRKRREEITEKFAKKCLSNPRFAHWFPVIEGRTSLRHCKHREVFLEEKARCERLRNSPLFYFRRILNGKVGKTYGTRNKQYREEVVEA